MNLRNSSVSRKSSDYSTKNKNVRDLSRRELKRRNEKEGGYVYYYCDYVDTAAASLYVDHSKQSSCQVAKALLIMSFVLTL